MGSVGSALRRREDIDREIQVCEILAGVDVVDGRIALVRDAESFGLHIQVYQAEQLQNAEQPNGHTHALITMAVNFGV